MKEICVLCGGGRATKEQLEQIRSGEALGVVHLSEVAEASARQRIEEIKAIDFRNFNKGRFLRPRILKQ